METNRHHHYLSEKISKKRLSDYLFQKKDIDHNRCLGLTLTMRNRSNLGEKLDENTVLKNFRFLMNRLEQKTVRRRKNRKGRRIKTFPILEKGMNQRYHYHVLMEIPDKYLNRRDEFQEWIKDSWIKTPFGLWEMKIDPLYNENGWKEYISKSIDCHSLCFLLNSMGLYSISKEILLNCMGCLSKFNTFLRQIQYLFFCFYIF